MTFRRICFVLFACMGILMLFQSIRNIVRIHAVEKWKQTEASVDSIHILREENRKTDHFYPVIQYHYKIDGVTFYGDQLNFESGFLYNYEWMALNEAERYLNKEDKSKMLIYYDPENPGDSVISRGKTDGEYQLMFYGVVFLVIGLLANRREMIAIIKQWLKRKE